MSRNVVSCMQPAGHDNDWVDSKGTDGKPTFRRLANLSWLSEICNHFGDIAAWNPKSLKTVAQKLPFWKEVPLRANFQKCFRKDSPPLRSTSCVQISWNLADQKSVKSCVIYQTKKNKNLALSHSRFCADCDQNLPGPAANNVLRVPKFHPNPFTSCRVITKHVNTIQTRHKVFPILSEAIASLRVIKLLQFPFVVKSTL